MPFLNSKEKIFYRLWDIPDPKANVVFLHGAGEHSGLYNRFAFALNSNGFRVWAIDHIAHGNTPGTVDMVYDISNLAKNVRTLMEFIQSQNPSLKTILAGSSLGGVTAGFLMSEKGSPKISGLVLVATPLAPLKNIEELDKVIMSKDPFYLDEVENDPLLKQMKELDYYKLDEGLVSAAKSIKEMISIWTFPILLVNGENDALAPAEIAKEWAIKAEKGKALTIKDGNHDIINDVSHQIVSRIISTFAYESTCDLII